jgi:Aminoglycoside-2''-adenylyltransferase
MYEKSFHLEKLLLQVALAAQKHNKPYYFRGGIAVDLTFGGLSRPHEDLDFYPLEVDTEWWKD